MPITGSAKTPIPRERDAFYNARSEFDHDGEAIYLCTRPGHGRRHDPHHRGRGARLGLARLSSEASTPHSLTIITVADGALTLRWDEGSLQVPVGSSVVVPALLGSYSLAGDAIVLRSTVPPGDAD